MSTEPVATETAKDQRENDLPSEVEVDEMITLLDEIGMSFTKTQHHPLSYLEGSTDLQSSTD